MPAAVHSEHDDQTLFARAISGDVDAYGELIRRHQQAALRLAAVICGSTQEAEDIVQDAFVNAHRHLGSYRGTGSLRSWMLRVVANEAKNHVRGRVRRVHREDRAAGLALRVGESAEQVAERHFEQEALAAALMRLGANDRHVLACRFVAGLSEAETAEVLDVALGTVKSRTSRALARLHTELEPVRIEETR